MRYFDFQAVATYSGEMRGRGDSTILWTQHAQVKMRHYRLTESRVKRIIRHPARREEGILEGAVACMQPADGKQYSEIWAMFVLSSGRASEKLRRDPPSRGSSRVGLAPPTYVGDHGRSTSQRFQKHDPRLKCIKVITAWRYPGKSPERDPIPSEVLKEIRSLL